MKTPGGVCWEEVGCGGHKEPQPGRLIHGSREIVAQPLADLRKRREGLPAMRTDTAPCPGLDLLPCARQGGTQCPDGFFGSLFSFKATWSRCPGCSCQAQVSCGMQWFTGAGDGCLGDDIGSGERAGRVPPGSLGSFTCSLSHQAPSCAAGRGTGSCSTWMAAWFTTTTRRSGTWTAGSTSSTAAGTCGSAASARVSTAPAPEPCIPNPIPHRALHVAVPLLNDAVHIQHTP